MIKDRFSIRVERERLQKLREVSEQRRKTMTQLVEDWIDSLQSSKKEK